VTLGRIKTQEKLINWRKLKQKIKIKTNITLKHLYLFESELTSQGSIYHPLTRFPLTKP
jgi:2'-5' RNA ligase